MEKDFNKTYVALIDILGFKELVKNNCHEELIKVYETFDNAIKGGLTLFNSYFEDEKFQPNLKLIKINSFTISDSLILWTDNLKYYNFFNLIVTVRAILSESMRFGIPLRGAIVVGPLSIREEKLSSTSYNIKYTCFGKSIVDAYILSESQNWSGCIISQECIKEYENAIIEFKSTNLKYTPEQIDRGISLTSLERKYLIRKYLVPYKEGNLRNEYVVNWVNEFSPKWNPNSIRLNFGKHKKPVDNWKVETLIRNTIEFANDCPVEKKNK